MADSTMPDSTMAALVSSANTRSALTATYLLHTPESFVRTPLPGLLNGAVVIHAAPALGAGFVWMSVELAAGGSLAAGTVSRFFYIVSGTGTLAGPGIANPVQAGHYAFSATAVPLVLTASTALVAMVLDKHYEPLAGISQSEPAFVRREQDVAPVPLGGDPSVMVRTLMPADNQFDFAVNTMTYGPGASLAQVEVHYMEHGLLMLEGEGMYLLNDTWYAVQAGDFIWMKAFCPQWFQASAAGAKYLIYKNFNRMPALCQVHAL